jgi:hypothetical protein
LRLRVAPKAPPRHARSHGGALAYVRSLFSLHFCVLTSSLHLCVVSRLT